MSHDRSLVLFLETEVWKNSSRLKISQGRRFPQGWRFSTGFTPVSLRRESSLLPECLVEFSQAWQVTFFQRVKPETSMRIEQERDWAEQEFELRTLPRSEYLVTSPNSWGGSLCELKLLWTWWSRTLKSTRQQDSAALVVKLGRYKGKALGLLAVFSKPLQVQNRH